MNKLLPVTLLLVPAGASFTLLTVIATLSLSVPTGPEPVLPLSLVCTEMASGPLGAVQLRLAPPTRLE